MLAAVSSSYRVARTSGKSIKACEEEEETAAAGGESRLLGMGLEEIRKIYIRNLELLPTQINLTFTKEDIKKRDTLLQRYQNRHQDAYRGSNSSGGGSGGSSSGGGVSSLLLSLLEILVGATGSISSAPINLRGYQVHHAYGTQRNIIKTIRGEIINQVKWQLTKIVGSLDLVGNPINLMQGLGSGMFDFFYEPAQGLIHISPIAFGRGVARGVPRRRHAAGGAASAARRSGGPRRA